MPTSRSRLGALLVAALASALTVTMVGTAPASHGEEAPTWSPTNGVVISNPRGTTAQKYVVQDRIVKMINYTPSGEFIRIAMWNVESSRVVNALLAAHKRGVTVRILMDEANRPANPEWGRLQSGLKVGNTARPADRRSIAKSCVDTCRGGAGAMHSKLLIFTRVGGATDVVMHGAANLTAAIVLRQWVDMATFVNSPDTFNFWNRIFSQMWLDTPVYPQFRDLAFGRNRQMVYPFRGAEASSRVFPVLEYLRRTSCTGVVNAGSGGRTVIRIGIASLRQEPGLQIAQRLKTLWNQGCNIRLIYAVMGGDSYAVLRSTSGRGPVPIRHVVSDPNRDDTFDQYLHTKYLVISGKFGTNPSEKLVLMGSPNWASLSLISDENGAVMRWPGVVGQYWNFTDRWYNNPPPYNRVTPAPPGGRRTDPYAQIRKDTNNFAD